MVGRLLREGREPQAESDGRAGGEEAGDDRELICAAAMADAATRALAARLLAAHPEHVPILVENASGDAALANSKFLASRDTWFRPVHFQNGPDGCLYVVDMYRGIVQHTAFLTHYLVANIKARQLEQPISQGRIWRIVPEGGRKVARTAIPADAASRVKLLAHADGWVRDTAQRLLVEAGDSAIGPSLKTLATDAQAPAQYYNPVVDPNCVPRPYPARTDHIPTSMNAIDAAWLSRMMSYKYPGGIDCIHRCQIGRAHV